ncbi:FMN-binding protein [Dielma fastidiosa]|uniref:FMN-binding protein n=1 Tax=Dielma fastidiosa TaxID=1034346 RepID=A0AB35USH7_9FIRM|nr:FMN-binding protein [Dielma fastidiosa]MDY5168144.1 FMN-binding protein [Dielma fastidiosa]
MKKYKKRLLLACPLLLLISIGLAIGANALHQANRLSVKELDRASLKDGDTLGEYTILLVSVKVQVTIKNHQIVDIDLLQHLNGLGKPAEAIIPMIIEQQSLKIDTVSNATISSKCILKAVEAAVGEAYE